MTRGPSTVDVVLRGQLHLLQHGELLFELGSGAEGFQPRIGESLEEPRTA